MPKEPITLEVLTELYFEVPRTFGSDLYVEVVRGPQRFDKGEIVEIEKQAFMYTLRKGDVEPLPAGKYRCEETPMERSQAHPRKITCIAGATGCPRIWETYRFVKVEEKAKKE